MASPNYEFEQIKVEIRRRDNEVRVTKADLLGGVWEEHIIFVSTCTLLLKVPSAPGILLALNPPYLYPS